VQLALGRCARAFVGASGVFSERLSPAGVFDSRCLRSSRLLALSVAQTNVSLSATASPSAGRPGSRTINSVPTTSDRWCGVDGGPAPGQLFHTKGRGNGYIVTLGGKRVYFAGDTECVPEIKALKNIDVAFMPMNPPYTMTPVRQPIA
jgi:hypothetical protein